MSIRSVEGLAAPPPRQSCTNIDKVDNEMLQHAPERLELKSLRWGAELHTDCSSNPLTSSDSPRSRAEVQGGYFVKICWFGLFEGEYLWQICVSMMDKRKLDIKKTKNVSTKATPILSCDTNVAPPGQAESECR